MSCLFSAGGRDYDLEEVLQAADFRGELEPLRGVWSAAWQAAGAAQEAGLEPDQDMLDQLATEFRYAHNLVTADECEAWLAAAGVTADEFGDHFLRLAVVAPAGLFAEAAEAAVSVAFDAETTRAFHVDILLSGHLPAMARALAWRVALKRDGRPAPGPREIAERKASGLENLHLTKPNAEDWPVPWRNAPGWFEELSILEALFDAESKDVLIPDNQERALAASRISLLRLEVEVLELESEAAAREALLCVTEDGVSLADLAAQNGHSLRVINSFLEDFPEEWRQGLLSAVAGKAMPPFAVGDAFQFCRLLQKHDPALADPGVLARVNTNLLQAHFRELENRHIRWQVNLEVEE